MRKTASLTENEARYLKLIYRAWEDSRQLGTTDIARILGVQPPSVTEVLQILHSKGLLRYKRYKKIEITKLGIKVAGKLLRRHRILEVYFADILKCSPEEACEEASRVDFHFSDRAIDALSRIYSTRTCPCGKHIPVRSQVLREREHTSSVPNRVVFSSEHQRRYP